MVNLTGDERETSQSSEGALRTVEVFEQGRLSRGWTHIASTDSANPETDRDLIFYRRDAGSAALAGPSGGFHTVLGYKAGAFSPCWTHVVRHSGSMDVSSGLMLRWGQMQGVCWPLSAAPGEDIDFRLSTAASSCTVSFVRFRNRRTATPADIDNSRELREDVISMPGDLVGVEGWNVPFGATTLAEGGASGFEVDAVASAPLNLIATGTNVSQQAAMVRYRYGGNGFVFSLGSISFGGSLVVDGNLQQVVRNALDACLEAARAKWVLSTPPGLFRRSPSGGP